MFTVFNEVSKPFKKSVPKIKRLATILGKVCLFKRPSFQKYLLSKGAVFIGPCCIIAACKVLYLHDSADKTESNSDLQC